jgi:hypothetical protein
MEFGSKQTVNRVEELAMIIRNQNRNPGFFLVVSQHSHRACTPIVGKRDETRHWETA